MTTLAQIENIQGQREQNRDDLGRIMNQALDLRLQAEERRLVISALGMAPEQGDRYAATTGELLADLREDIR